MKGGGSLAPFHSGSNETGRLHARQVKRLANVDQLLQRYAGREQELMRGVRQGGRGTAAGAGSQLRHAYYYTIWAFYTVQVPAAYPADPILPASERQ